MRHPLDHRGIGRRQRRRFAVGVIGNAEPAAEIDMLDVVAVGAQRLHEIGKNPERGFHLGEIGDLAADMHVGAGHLDARQLGRAGIDLARPRDRNAELVLGLAGGDLGMGAGIDVRIDPQRNPRGLAGLDRKLRQQFQFGLGLDVDAENVRRQRRAQFGLGLADAREQDLARRNPRRQRALQFAAGHHVGPGAELGQRAQHRLVGIRLHGVADQRLLAGKGLGEDAVVALQRRRRIAIERRADGIREFGQVDGFGVQHAVAIVEMVHGALIAFSSEVDTGSRQENASKQDSSPAADRERISSCRPWGPLGPASDP